MASLLLGKNVEYRSNYNPDLLFKIARSDGRLYLPNMNYYGFDVWNCYEVSWLNPSGKPEVRILELYIDSSSEFIIESKSLKLYLFSLNNEKFASDQDVHRIIKNDLESLLGCSIYVNMKTLQEYENIKIEKPQGSLIDDEEIEEAYTEPNRSIIKLMPGEIEEKLYSNLLKTNCLITSQPDWATLIISYKGRALSRKSLLEYIISFRSENMFHEHSVERIFTDIASSASYEKLVVEARYTRRGGIDINPIRSLCPIDLNTIEIANKPLARQ